MPKSARIDIIEHWYHIIVRGQRKNPVFFSTADRHRFLEILDKSLIRHRALLGAYCLMTNHIHLIVYRGGAPLGNIFNTVLGTYARYFNNRYGLVGYVFQGRFKSKIVLNESYLDALLNYIHMNPVKVGMRKSPEDYVWSSDRFYRGYATKTIESLVRIPGYEGQAGTLKYIEVMRNSLEYPQSREYYIGTEKERKRMDCRSRDISRQSEKRGHETLAERISILAKAAVIPLSELKSTRRTRNISKIRADIMVVLYEEGFAPSEIAREFNRTPSAVIRAVERNAKSQ